MDHPSGSLWARPPISFLISLLKVGGAGTHLACHGLPASKGPSVSTKGATRTCGADYRLRMRLPPQALPRVSVSAWGPGPSLAISRAWDLIQVRGVCCGGRASRCACAGAGRPAPALLFGVVGPGMMGTEARGDRPPSQAGCWRGGGSLDTVLRVSGFSPLRPFSLACDRPGFVTAQPSPSSRRPPLL